MPLPPSVRRLAQAMLLLLAAIAAAAAPGPARADIRIDITQGDVQPIPIAVTAFYGDTPQAAQLGQNVAAVIAADLDRSGLFRPLPPNAFLQDPASLNAGPRFGDWAAISAQALVSGALATQADGRIRAEFRLWDVTAQSQLIGFGLQTEPGNWRRLAHQVADAIYERITGDKGYFDTRIVYVSESGPATQRVKRLAMMDQDGENNRFLTDGSTLVLTPRFSPTSQLITYVAYAGGPPRVFLYNLQSGQQELLGDFPGMTFAPRFSPDGNRVIMSLAEGGNTDIWVMDLRTRAKQRLTNDPAIDTSPSFSPDGSQVVFESDRGGSQQIYVMSAGGGEARRISFGDGRYAGPVWSPRGDYIAFTKISGGQFGIGIIRPDGAGERLLAQNFLVEGPTWAPNGRVLMYFSQGQGGPVRLEAADITGRRKWTVPTPQEASDPAWSPLIP